jgi:hypothetical protein
MVSSLKVIAAEIDGVELQDAEEYNLKGDTIPALSLLASVIFDDGVFGADVNFTWDKTTKTLQITDELTGNSHNLIRLGTEWGAALFNRGGGMNESSASLATPGQGGTFSSFGSIARIAGSIAGEFIGSYSDGIQPGSFKFGDLPVIEIGNFDIQAAIAIDGLDLYGGTGALFCTLPNAFSPSILAGYLFGNYDPTGDNLLLESKLIDIDNGIAGSFTGFGNASFCDVINKTTGYFRLYDGDEDKNYVAAFGVNTTEIPYTAGVFDDEKSRVCICDGDNALTITGSIAQKDATQWDSSGSGSAVLGSNCPATTVTDPYKWLKILDENGDIVYVPAWK